MKTGQLQSGDRLISLGNDPAANPVALRKQKRATKRGLIELSIPAELIHYFSSDEYADLVNSGLSGSDVIATWIARYPGVMQSILSNSSQMGAVIEFTSSHWYFALLFYLAMGVASAVNFGLALKEKGANHQAKSESYKRIHKLFHPELEKKDKHADVEFKDEKHSHPTAQQVVERLNKAFVQLIRENTALNEKYQSIKLHMPTGPNADAKLEIQFQLGPQDGLSLRVLSEHELLPEEFKREVKESKTPVLIKRGNTFSIYGSKAEWKKTEDKKELRDTKHQLDMKEPSSEPEWKETEIKDLSDAEKNTLNELFSKGEDEVESKNIRGDVHALLLRGHDVAPLQSDEVAEPGWFKKYVVNKFLSPIYNAISLSSFAYWIFFIGAAIITGNFADVGIEGVATWLALGTPAVIGAGYVGLKVRNWYRHKGVEGSDEDARLRNIADGDSQDLLIQAIRLMELIQEIERLDGEYTPVDYTVCRADSTNATAQAAAAMYTTTVGRYTEAQYNAWILTDFMKSLPMVIFAIPFFGEIAGSVLMAIGVGFGAYEAHKKYKAAQAANGTHPLEPGTPAPSLRDVYVQRQADLREALTGIGATLIASSLILRRPVPALPKPQSTARTIWNFFDAKATGIYFARIFCTAGAALLLPFAALALSNPITIGLLVLSGLIFVGVKMYQAYKKAQEVEARAMIAAIQDIDEKIKVAKLISRNEGIRNDPGVRYTADIEMQPMRTVRPAVAPASRASSSSSLFTPGSAEAKGQPSKSDSTTTVSPPTDVSSKAR